MKCLLVTSNNCVQVQPVNMALFNFRMNHAKLDDSARPKFIGAYRIDQITRIVRGIDERGTGSSYILIWHFLDDTVRLEFIGAYMIDQHSTR
jgi:hypothetical protein